MPPLARVVQEDGKLLIQAVLEVRSTVEKFLNFSDVAVGVNLCGHISPLLALGHRGRGVSEPDGPVCRSAFQSEQALLFSARFVAEGGAAASWLPVITGHS